MHALPSAALLGTALLLCCSCERRQPPPALETGELRIEFPALTFRLDSGTDAGPFEANYALSRETLERLLAQKGYRTEQLRSFHFIRADVEFEETMSGGLENLSLYLTPPVNGASRLAQLDTMAAVSKHLELEVNRVEAQEAVLRRSMALQLSGNIRSSLTQPVAGSLVLAGTAVVEH